MTKINDTNDLEQYLQLMTETAEFLVVRDSRRRPWIVAENEWGEVWAQAFPDEELIDNLRKVLDSDGFTNWFDLNKPFEVLHVSD